MKLIKLKGKFDVECYVNMNSNVNFYLVQVAVKVIDKTQMNQTSIQKLNREMKIMKRLDHPNIVRLYEVRITGFIVVRLSQNSVGLLCFKVADRCGLL